MTHTKTTLCGIEKCYSCCGAVIHGAPMLFFAGEGDGSMRVFSGEGFQDCDVIWQGGGGTMSIVPLSFAPGWLLASRGFYSMVDSAGSTIELLHYDGQSFSHRAIAGLPYLHRFGVVQGDDGKRWVIAATIAGYKESKEDWSHPGGLYAAILPDDLSGDFRLELDRLPGEYTQNHGFCTARYMGKDCAYISAMEGVFRLVPPQAPGHGWDISSVLSQPVSDIALCDIDGDGEDELAAILPFHGDRFKVYKNIGGVYEEAYSHGGNNDFYHTVTSGVIDGRPCFVGGARKLDAQLFLLSWEGAFKTLLIDAGEGPSNAAIFNLPGRDLLLAANRQTGKADVYAFDHE